ncbi:DUF4235 domain-containing protein [Streptomyces chumphonensis]|uniref:DUF4235 domain-containing protein n=2 Tax=Streptomyces chumphonensis TaxID=1214925 RepID=A0A927F4A8_9ACTN|nr:DUF4235 domain-containing protein [Streptomyces chumphonensis]MBD3933919.1 DUF4235 domain-containing protein [Streptomyces chumphonensis]
MSAVLNRAGTLSVGLVGGVVAGAIFKQVWKVVAHQEDTPDATDIERSWREVLLAAAVHGAIFAVVKAVLQRGGVLGARRVRRRRAT